MEQALDWLQRPPVPPFVSAAASTGRRDAGALYDGLLGHTPAASLVAVDLLGGSDARAASLRDLVPPGAAVARQSALWVHTGRLRPERVAVVVPPDRRLHAAARVHRQCLVDDDVTHLGGVATTTRLRTAVDLLRFCGPELAVPGVRLLLAAGLSVERVRQALAPGGRSPARRARELLSLAVGESR